MKWFFTFALLVFAHLSSSQTTVQGVVFDLEENPVGFAHIYNVSMGLGKVSDINGKFQLIATRGDTLRISYVGYETLYMRLEHIHLTNYLRVVLPKDSILLPSITIYADKNFRVPLNIRGEPIFIPGVSLTGPRIPYSPGSLSYGLAGIGGVPVPAITISGPISYFTDEYKEKRMAQEAYQETAKTITYQKYIAQDSVRTKLCLLYDLDSVQYDKIIIRLNQAFPGIQEAKRPQEIWLWLLTHFDRQVPVVKY